MDPAIASRPVETPQHRTRLILKDGSYQAVLSYTVEGNRVRYRSAERNGQTEEIPLALVDLPATRAWQHDHDPSTAMADAPLQTAVLSPELAAEEAARAARTPEVAPDLRLQENYAVLLLDTFRGTPELVPVPQGNSDLNRETAHAVLRRAIAPGSGPHDLLLLPGERADVQTHVSEPAFYVRQETSAAEEETGNALVVDTGGRTGEKEGGGAARQNTYLIEHLDVRRGARALSSVRLNLLGTGKAQPDVVEMRAEPLPGGFWLKLTPLQPLEFGEYALVEVLDGGGLNQDVWDFGVHPTARANDEAFRPEPRKPAQLQRR